MHSGHIVSLIIRVVYENNVILPFFRLFLIIKGASWLSNITKVIYKPLKDSARLPLEGIRDRHHISRASGSGVSYLIESLKTVPHVPLIWYEQDLELRTIMLLQIGKYLTTVV